MIPIIVAAVREHWPKIVAAVLVAVCLAFVAKCERKEKREEERMIDVGRQDEVIKQQQEVLNNVQKANTAERNPTLDDRERMRQRYDRCAGGGCE